MSVPGRNDNEKVKCFACGRDVPRYGNEPEWYGTLRGQEVIEAVCVECYAQGKRPPEMADFERRRAAK
jgi:tRNA G26 N,N-dimethylase Trm1